MKSRCVFATLMFFALLAQAASEPELAPLPVEFSLMGNGGPQALPGRCELGLDASRSADGRRVYSVACSNTQMPSFGGARYSVPAQPYRGKRVRVSASLMASGIEKVDNPQYPQARGEAGLWLGIGSKLGGTRMDRMEDRTITGTTDWVVRDFVADVPPDSNQIQIGFWMQGKGQVWVRDIQVEEVPQTVAVNFQTNRARDSALADVSLETRAAPGPNAAFLPPPPRWLPQGNVGFELCDAGVDARMLAAGQRNLSIACSVPTAMGLRQGFESAPYAGRRVRFSGWVRTENFEPMPSGNGDGGAGIMLYTDTNTPALHANHAGTAEWEHHELVMEVPRQANFVLIGLAFSGKGQVWVRDLKFEEVDRDTPVSPLPGRP